MEAKASLTHFTFPADALFDSTVPTVKNNRVKTEINGVKKGAEGGGIEGGGKKKKRKIGRNFHQYNKGSEGKYKPLVIIGT